jgi:hypothetical protein
VHGDLWTSNVGIVEDTSGSVLREAFPGESQHIDASSIPWNIRALQSSKGNEVEDDMSMWQWLVLPTPLGEKDKNQSQYRGISREAGGNEYAKSIVGQNSLLAGIP